MVTPEERNAKIVRRLWIATFVAVASMVVMRYVMHWGLLPAVIGGFSVGVIWWSINRAFAQASENGP